MPKIDLSVCNLTSDEYALAKGILNGKTGELRATKPPVSHKVESEIRSKLGHPLYVYHNEADANLARTAYIWRMVAFMVSPLSRHQCMPITAEFDLPGDLDERKDEVKRLDKIVDKIVDSIPVNLWYGVHRWGKALDDGI